MSGPDVLNLLLPSIGTVLALIGLWWTIRVQRRADATRLRETDNQLTARIITLETKVELFWRAVSVPAAALLHSPHPEHARRDALLEAFIANQLGLAEAGELAALIETMRADPATPAAERLAAGTVLGYLAARFGLPTGPPPIHPGDPEHHRDQGGPHPNGQQGDWHPR